MDKRLIDAKALVEEINSLTVRIGTRDIFPKKAKESVLQVIDSAPTIDAVVPVKCSECKQFIKFSDGLFGLCKYFNWTMRINDYCSYGEKESEGK